MRGARATHLGFRKSIGPAVFAAALFFGWPSPMRAQPAADPAEERVLPMPFGVGFVYYFLHRDIEIRDLKIGRNGAPPTSVGSFAQLASVANVNSLNLRIDAWVLPFLNVHAIVGGIWNRATTNVEVTLPSAVPGGAPRSLAFSVPTELSGPVGGIGVTLVGGLGNFFAAADLNAARLDMGFSDRYEAFLPSLRAGWKGRIGSHPARAWLNGTYWFTSTIAKGTVADPDGGTLSFEVDQRPLHSFTGGVGFSYGISRRIDVATDFATDFHGGWYATVLPVFRF